MAQKTLVKGAYVTKKTLILRHNSFSFGQGVIIWAYIYMYDLKRCPTVIMPSSHCLFWRPLSTGFG